MQYLSPEQICVSVRFEVTCDKVACLSNVNVLCKLSLVWYDLMDYSNHI